MAKVTWLGDGSDAEENTWKGQTFKKGEAVEVKDEAMVNKAKHNKYYKVEGDKSETVEDNPPQVTVEGRADDLPENAAFASQEVLTARRQQSIEDQRDGDAPGDGKGGSRTFNERHPPKGGKPATPDRRTSEHR